MAPIFVLAVAAHRKIGGMRDRTASNSRLRLASSAVISALYFFANDAHCEAVEAACRVSGSPRSEQALETRRHTSSGLRTGLSAHPWWPPNGSNPGAFSWKTWSAEADHAHAHGGSLSRQGVKEATAGNEERWRRVTEATVFTRATGWNPVGDARRLSRSLDETARLLPRGRRGG